MAQEDSGGGPKNREAAYISDSYMSEEDEER